MLVVLMADCRIYHGSDCKAGCATVDRRRKWIYPPSVLLGSDCETTQPRFLAMLFVHESILRAQTRVKEQPRVCGLGSRLHYY
jgi:hypothetical protein